MGYAQPAISMYLGIRDGWPQPTTRMEVEGGRAEGGMEWESTLMYSWQLWGWVSGEEAWEGRGMVRRRRSAG